MGGFFSGQKFKKGRQNKKGEGSFLQGPKKKRGGGPFCTQKNTVFYPPKRVLHRVYPSSHVFYFSGFSATLCFHTVVFKQQCIEPPITSERKNPSQSLRNQKKRLKSPINGLDAPIHAKTRIYPAQQISLKGKKNPLNGGLVLGGLDSNDFHHFSTVGGVSDQLNRFIPTGSTAITVSPVGICFAQFDIVSSLKGLRIRSNH